jgi:hypothetical protein
MADNIWLLQFLFYIAICFILAVVMRGWIGFFAGILGGFIGIGVIFILISGGQGDTFADRGR